jgi:hypothetical protein
VKKITGYGIAGDLLHLPDEPARDREEWRLDDWL